jgi:hypothetical protein
MFFSISFYFQQNTSPSALNYVIHVKYRPYGLETKNRKKKNKIEELRSRIPKVNLNCFNFPSPTAMIDQRRIPTLKGGSAGKSSIVFRLPFEISANQLKSEIQTAKGINN